MSTSSSAPSLPLAWQVCPGGSPCVVGAVALSDDGGTVIAGTRVFPEAEYATGPMDWPEVVVLGAYGFDRHGRQLWADPITGWRGVRTVAVSGDGRFAAAAGDFDVNPPAGFVRAYAADTGQVLLDDRTRGTVRRVALSRDGTWLVAAAERVLVYCRVQGTTGFTRVAEAGADPGETGGVVGVDLSADGTVIVFRTAAGQVGLLHNSGGTVVPLNLAYGPAGTTSGDLWLTPTDEAIVLVVGTGEVWCVDQVRFRTGTLEDAVLSREADAGLLTVVVGAGGCWQVAMADAGMGLQLVATSGKIVTELDRFARGWNAIAAGRAPRSLALSRAGNAMVGGGDDCRLYAFFE